MAHVPPLPDNGSFSGATQKHTFDGFLFDMDGTIIDSTDAIVKHWHKLAAELGVSASEILKSSHGRRSVDTLALYDPSKANWEYVNRIEGAIPREYGPDAVEVPGARALLDRLTALAAPWAIVTSGTRALMSGWLDVMRLPEPRVAVVAEDVERGKPDPQCYALGRRRIGLPDPRPGNDGDAATAATAAGGAQAQAHAPALVLEDAPAGVAAGKAAGCPVLALATTHAIPRLIDAGADWIVRDLRSVRVEKTDVGAYEVTIDDIWVEK